MRSGSSDLSQVIYKGTIISIGVNLGLAWRLKPQLYKLAPACAGSKTLDFTLVRAGGLGFYSREFHSLGLKLTPMDNIVPLPYSESLNLLFDAT